jgi:hypothetical protein
LIFGDFFAHQENIWITLQLFSKRFIQCLAIRDFSHKHVGVLGYFPSASPLREGERIEARGWR